MDFEQKKIGVFGLQGSGKTYFIKNYLKNTNKKFFIYDLGAEYSADSEIMSKHIIYTPKFRQGEQARDEVNRIIKNYYMPLALRNGVDGLILDEASLVMPNKKPIPEALFTLNERNRHIGKNGQIFIFSSRRPTQVATDCVELAHKLIIFNLAGKNDRAYLNCIREGAGDTAVDKLGRYSFMVLDETRQIKVYKPVK